MAVAAHLWLYDQHGLILFLRRSNTGYADGQWSVPAGHVELGETIASACVREAREEVGVDILEDDLQFKLVQHKHDIDGDERIDVFFAASLRRGSEVSICEPDHCDAISWQHPADPPTPLVAYVAAALRHLDSRIPVLAYWGFERHPTDHRPNFEEGA